MPKTKKIETVQDLEALLISELNSMIDEGELDEVGFRDMLKKFSHAPTAARTKLGGLKAMHGQDKEDRLQKQMRRRMAQRKGEASTASRIAVGQLEKSLSSFQKQMQSSMNQFRAKFREKVEYLEYLMGGEQQALVPVMADLAKIADSFDQQMKKIASRVQQASQQSGEEIGGRYSPIGKPRGLTTLQRTSGRTPDEEPSPEPETPAGAPPKASRPLPRRTPNGVRQGGRNRNRSVPQEDDEDYLYGYGKLSEESGAGAGSIGGAIGRTDKKPGLVDRDGGRPSQGGLAQMGGGPDRLCEDEG